MQESGFLSCKDTALHYGCAAQGFPCNMQSGAARIMTYRVQKGISGLVSMKQNWSLLRKDFNIALERVT